MFKSVLNLRVGEQPSTLAALHLAVVDLHKQLSVYIGASGGGSSIDHEALSNMNSTSYSHLTQSEKTQTALTRKLSWLSM